MTYEQSRRTTTAQVNQNALKALLEFNGLTYREAALRCKVSTGTIGNIVSGKRQYVNPETAGKIAKGFKVDASTLFTLVQTVDSTRHALSA